MANKRVSEIPDGVCWVAAAVAVATEGDRERASDRVGEGEREVAAAGAVQWRRRQQGRKEDGCDG